jgi:SAM-dependent methyltransferase
MPLPPIDFTNVDMNALALQLRKPEGEYGKQVGKMMAVHNTEVTAFTLKHLQVKDTDHMLEIGFGPGEGIAQAVQLTPNGFVAGIDYSQDMITMAEERNHRAIMQEHIELTLGEASAMPYGDESFDKIFAVNVFHFWKDPAKELSECRRVLKSGGRIAFFMAHAAAYRPGFIESGVFIPREPEDVERLLSGAGFSSLQSHSITMEEFKGFATIGEKE